MAYGITFARHFAQLVVSVGAARASIEEQKLNLRAAAAATHGGVVRLHVDRHTLYADDEPVSPIFTGIRDLASQFEAHGVVGLEAQGHASPADLLFLARAFAAPAVPGALGALLRDRPSTTVRLAFVADQPVMPEPAPVAAPTPIVEPEDAQPVAAPPEESMPAVATDAASLFQAVAGARTARDAVPGLLAALAEPQTPHRFARILDELCTFVEVSQREGHFEDALAAYHGLATAEASIEAPEARRALIVALRRLARPAVLDAIVRLAVRRLPADPQALFVLQRVGDDAVAAIVERAVNARSTTMRQQLLQVLRQLPAAGSGLGHTVGTARPVVARQAARIAAELGIVEAENGLAQAAEQARPEVRREALAALAALETPRAVDAHLRALRDDEVIVRLQAAAGLVHLKPDGVVASLASALNDEAEPEVQVALVQAIGRAALPESVEPLAKAAEPAKGLFRKKSLALRVAAVHALAQLRVPGVSSVLQGLSQDKERAVRDALAQATRVHGRRTTRAMQAIPG